MILASFSNWLKDDSGAVAVDWTVLAAAIVGIGIASVTAVRSGTGALATSIGDSLSSASIAVLGELGSGDGSTLADYAHELLNVSQDVYDAWMRALASYDDSSLLSNYAACALAAAQFIAEGDAPSAGLYIDAMAAYQQELTSRGVDLPEGSASVQDLDDAYQAMG